MVWSSGFIDYSTGLGLRVRVLFMVWSSGVIDYSTGLGLRVRVLFMVGVQEL